MRALTAPGYRGNDGVPAGPLRIRPAVYRAQHIGPARPTSSSSVLLICDRSCSHYYSSNMETVFTVLILLVAVGVSGLSVRGIPFKLPLPLIQIAIGAALAWPGFGLHVTFEPDLFMLLFIPPLLFADGWRIPKREFFKQRNAILMLALGLVFLTVVALGYFVHFLIPAIPLPVAFALAAVLSPTDAVALSGIAPKGAIPSHLMQILEGEALMNDASGLVALKFATAAALTGMFSLRAASISFVIIAAGGLVVGSIVGWLCSVVLTRLTQSSEEDDPAAGIIMTLLIPFAAYLCAERMGCSGILAAVSAGMMMNWRSLRTDVPTVARLRMRSTWAMIEFVFNGMTFVLLGLQFPHTIGTVVFARGAAGYSHLWLLLGYVSAVMMGLHTLRFAWIWLLRWVASRKAAVSGVVNAVPGWRTVGVMTIGGVRGAVTLAGILSLPLVLNDGTPVPGRELAIFIASGTILMSLLIGVVGLPLTLRGVATENKELAEEERYARAEAAHAAIRALNESHEKLTAGLDEASSARVADSFARVMDLYRRQLALSDDKQTLREAAHLGERMDTALRTTALRAQRHTLFKLRRSQKINDETLNKLLSEIDLADAAIFTRTRNRGPVEHD